MGSDATTELPITTDRVNRVKTYGYDEQNIPKDMRVSSVRVIEHGPHATLTVWTRGGNSGSLVVPVDDGHELAKLLVLSQDFSVAQIREALEIVMGLAQVGTQDRATVEAEALEAAYKLGRGAGWDK